MSSTIKILVCWRNKMNDLNDMTREQLIGQIMYLRKKVDRLEYSLNEMSWRLNPDRMGGQFSEWETNCRGDEWS
jgi:hypothetical protein